VTVNTNNLKSAKQLDVREMVGRCKYEIVSETRETISWLGFKKDLKKQCEFTSIALSALQILIIDNYNR